MLIISDICHMKSEDGTPCMLLCCPFGDRKEVRCIEMVGEKIRWQVDQQQMGDFFPSSIFVHNGMVYLADPVQHKLHLLSGEDGSVVTSVALGAWQVFYPSSVRAQGGYLYIRHSNYERNAYCISKFETK